MRKLVIISGLLFTAGNATWRLFGIEKIFWLPLGIFLWVLLIYAANYPKKASHPMKTSLYYLGALASGNIIKQAFYQDQFLQIDDYVWGACVTFVFTMVLFKNWILVNLKNLCKWATQIIRKVGGRA